MGDPRIEFFRVRVIVEILAIWVRIEGGGAHDFNNKVPSSPARGGSGRSGAEVDGGSGKLQCWR